MNYSKHSVESFKNTFIRSLIHGLGYKTTTSDGKTINYDLITFYENELKFSTLNEYNHFEKVVDGFYRIPFKTEVNFEREIIDLNGEPYEEPECINDDNTTPIIKKECKRYNPFVLFQPFNEEEEKKETEQEKNKVAQCSSIKKNTVAKFNKIVGTKPKY